MVTIITSQTEHTNIVCPSTLTFALAFTSSNIFKSIGICEGCIIKQSQAPIHGQAAATTYWTEALFNNSIQTYRVKEEHESEIFLVRATKT